MDRPPPPLPEKTTPKNYPQYKHNNQKFHNAYQMIPINKTKLYIYIYIYILYIYIYIYNI